MDVDWVTTNIKCCACGGTLETSELNVFVTEKLATWKSPVFGCFDIPDYGPRAVAIICDECLQKDTKVRFCIEWEDSPEQVKYHSIESLEDRNKSESQMKHYFGGKFKVKSEPKNTAANPFKVQKPKMSNTRLDLPARRRQVKPPFGGIGSKKTKNPEYFRLMKDEHFAGFKRIVTEYLPVSQARWQLDSFEYDAEGTQKLSAPAMGIATLGREKITSS